MRAYQDGQIDFLGIGRDGSNGAQLYLCGGDTLPMFMTSGLQGWLRVHLSQMVSSEAQCRRHLFGW